MRLKTLTLAGAMALSTSLASAETVIDVLSINRDTAS